MKKLLTNLSVLSAISISTLLIGCTNSDYTIKELSTEKVDYFADNALGNALAVVQHPAGIYQDDITYISYQGPLEDPYVLTYHHETKEWQGPFKAGISELGKDSTRKKKVDNHGKPTMLIDDDGYVHIFYGGHGGDKHHGKNLLGNIHYGGNKHSVSKRPYDITEWEDLDNISPFGTYNQAVKMDNGDIYLIYRHGAHRSDWVYQKSTDNGRTFEEPVSFLKHKKRTDIAANDSWYAFVTKGHNDDIIISYDYHVCWNNGAGINGRGHTTERHDAYYMVFDTKNDTWRNVQGDPLDIPVTKEGADAKTLVARTGGVDFWTFNGSAHLDQKGYPHVTTNIGKDLGEKTGGPKQTSYYRWTGTQWTGGNPINPQSRIDNTVSRGDFVINSPKDITVTLGYHEGDDGVIGKFHSKDGGETFTQGKDLLRRNNASWALTALIKDAHPEAQMIVAEKHQGTYWSKVYLVGENGPIQRNKNEATLITPENKARLK